MIGSQLRDLRTFVRWLQSRPEIDGQKLAIWGESFTRVNEPQAIIAVPLDAPDLPAYADPAAPLLTVLGALFEDGVRVVYSNGGLSSYRAIVESPYVYVAHDTIIPGAQVVFDLALPPVIQRKSAGFGTNIDGMNRPVGNAVASPETASQQMIEKLSGK